MRFVLSGGGTAGHINPALALAEELQKRGHEVFFAGTSKGVEARLVPEAGIPFESFDTTGFNRNHPTTIFKALTHMISATKAAKVWLNTIKPDVVVGFGAYVCIPVGRAAGALGIPLVVHEQNSVMGLANKYLARKAQVVAVTYKESASQLNSSDKVVVTGNPVRSSVLLATREEGRELLEVSEDALVLLAFGGSLGARHINEALTQMKDKLLSYDNLIIIHLAGRNEYKKVLAELALTESEQARWKVFSYQNNMGEVLAASDLVLARAGATSLSEISARQVPALLVPFPYATEDHQTTNAKAYIERGAARMVADSDLDNPVFEESLCELIESRDLREKMRAAAAEFQTSGAASRLADVVVASSDEGRMGTITQ